MSLTSLLRSWTANLAFTRLESLFLNVSGITRGYDFIWHTHTQYTQPLSILESHICCIFLNTGRKPGIVGQRPTTSCAHSKITRVRVLSWLLQLLTSLYFLWVTEVLSPSERSVTQNSAVIGQTCHKWRKYCHTIALWLVRLITQ